MGPVAKGIALALVTCQSICAPNSSSLCFVRGLNKLKKTFCTSLKVIEQDLALQAVHKTKLKLGADKFVPHASKVDKG